uniref:Uncharacterized protein n=1 Tax=Arundo donax TaxID=35708 RepID=A0A0A9A575_ARUDO
MLFCQVTCSSASLVFLFFWQVSEVFIIFVSSEKAQFSCLYPRIILLNRVVNNLCGTFEVFRNHQLRTRVRNLIR